ncbi:MAG: hypothetical protein KGJ02_07665 [Verrucomicrobiota bacterium]|nr:hypothetical protein [Verrucomicrobiota bacterium]
MLTEESRKDILNTYLNLIYIISDKEYQRKVWIQGELSGSDFDEICCLFFDDIGDPLLEHYKDFGISDDQYQLLKKFRDQFYIFSRKNDWPPEFIDTPAWDEVTLMAKEVLQAFNYRK